jgi:hypothetical protein
MAREVGDVTKQDPYPPPISGDTASVEATTSYASDAPRPVDTSGLSVVATIAGTGGASYDNPLPDDWAAPTTPSLIDNLSQFLPTAEGMQKAEAAEKTYAQEKFGLDAYFARQQDERDREFYRSMRSKLAQESKDASEIKPWNPITMAPPKHDLWEQFGSPAFLIAMMASSFTAMPMVSALNSGAAAMNAINQGDLDGYNRAFDEWKANTDLAIKRHAMEHTEFEDIGQLWDKDTAAGKARMATYLAQIDDKRKMALLNAGMYDELWKSVSGTHEAFNNIIKTIPAMLETKTLLDTLNKDERWTKATDQMGAWTDATRKMQEAKTAGRYGQTIPAQQSGEIAKRDAAYITANPQKSDESDEDFEKRRQAAHDANVSAVMTSYKPLETRRLNLAEWKAQQDQQHKQFLEDIANRKMTVDEARQKEDALHKENMDKIAAGRLDKEITAELEKERHDKAVEEIQKQAKTQITPNKAAELRIASDRYTTGIETIDKIVALIKRNVGSVGVAGHVLRAEESLSNVLKFSKETDRKEIERLINELQMLTPRLITESTSRPMASEHEHVSSVVGGLKAGDTRPNVLRNMDDLRAQLVRMKGNMDGIIQGKPFEPDTEKPKDTDTQPNTKPEWTRGVPAGTP